MEFIHIEPFSFSTPSDTADKNARRPTLHVWLPEHAGSTRRAFWLGFLYEVKSDEGIEPRKEGRGGGWVLVGVVRD